MSDFWRATTPSPVDIPGNFSSREFTFALQHLNLNKVPGPDSIFPELILHVGTALKTWFCGFLSLCLRRLKILKIWRRVLAVVIPYSKNPVENPESYRPEFCFVFPTRSSRVLSTPAWNQLSIHSSLGIRLNFDTRDQPWTKPSCSRKISRTFLKQRRRSVPCLST